MTAEMVRVTRPGGTVFLSFTPWCSPCGGHETAPWHYLGGIAPAVATGAGNGQEPKNRFGESLFPVSVGERAAVGADLPGRRRRRGLARGTTRGGPAGWCGCRGCARSCPGTSSS